MTEETKKQMQMDMGVLQTVCDSDPRAAEVMKFAVELGLERLSIFCEGKEYPAPSYALHMYVQASEIAEQIRKKATMEEKDRRDSGVNDNASLLICSIFVALAETRPSNWSYAAEVLYLRAEAGIRLYRDEIYAIMAQEGSFNTNGSKSDQLNGRLLAVSIYCGRLQALYHSLPECPKPFTLPRDVKEEETVSSIQDVCDIPDLRQRVEQLVRTFSKALWGNKGVDQTEMFLDYLASSDFYYAPASTKYHLSQMYGLVTHETHVANWLVKLLSPLMPEQAAKCVFASIGHDVCKINCYEPYAKNEKVYSENGQKSDSLGRFDWKEKLCFSFADTFPIGHGTKSMHIMASFFGSLLPKDVASAIDAHMLDFDKNPAVGRQVMENPLGLWLHMADCLASYIDEADM